jgi:hypothetical protein
MLTGEAWNEIFIDCKRTKSILFQCDENWDYNLKNTTDPQGCGNHSIAVLFMFSFVVLGSFIMLNMFISIIMDGYNTSNEQEVMRVNEYTIEAFKTAWMLYDKQATGLILVEDFPNLIIDLILKEIEDLPNDFTDNDEENILFNLRLKPSLVIYAKMARNQNIDEDGAII